MSTNQKYEESEVKEEKFRLLFENANDVIVYVDKFGKLIEVNKKVEDILGYKRKDIIGKNFFRLGFFRLSDAPRIFKLFKTAAKRGKVRGTKNKEVNIMELEIRRKNGAIAFIEASTTVIKKNGKLEGFLSILRDVTRSEQEGEQLKVSEEKYRNLVESAGDGIIYLDKWGKIIDVNTKILQIFGGPKKELVGKQFTKIGLFSPRDITKLMSNFVNILRGKEITTTVSFKNKKGNMIFLECSSSLIKKDKKIINIIVIARDITERKKAEEELKNSEKYLSIILDAIQTGIVIIDAETHNIVDVNPIAVKMIDAPKEKIIGLMCHKYICPAEKGKCPITDLGQTIDNSERVLLKANGERLPILKTVTPIMLKNHEYLLESFIDITERKKMEEETKKLNDQLKIKVEELERFYKLSVGRELKMVELKKKIEEVENKLKLREKEVKTRKK